MIRQAAMVLALLTATSVSAWAEVPDSLVEELGSVVEEALASDDGEARAWSLRAKALLGARAARFEGTSLGGSVWDRRARLVDALGTALDWRSRCGRKG